MKIRKLIFGLVAVTVLAACNDDISSSIPNSGEIPSVSTSGGDSSSIVREEVWEPAKHISFEPLQAYTGPFWNSVNFSLSGEALKNALYTFMRSRFTPVDYNKAYQLVRYMDKDPNPDNPDHVLSIYDLKSHPWAGYNGGKWNREHAFPQSKLDEKAQPDKKNVSSDIANIFASDAALNTARSNNSFGEWNYASDPETFYEFTQRNTAGELTDSILRRGYFSPTPLVRGEIARSQLYMLVMWKDHANTSENFALDLMLKWNYQYPPTEERDGQRQAILHEHQGVRNPFIDLPDLGCQIWSEYSQFTKNVCDTYASK